MPPAEYVGSRMLGSDPSLAWVLVCLLSALVGLAMAAWGALAFSAAFPRDWHAGMAFMGVVLVTFSVLWLQAPVLILSVVWRKSKGLLALALSTVGVLGSFLVVSGGAGYFIWDAFR